LPALALAAADPDAALADQGVVPFGERLDELRRIRCARACSTSARVRLRWA